MIFGAFFFRLLRGADFDIREIKQSAISDSIHTLGARWGTKGCFAEVRAKQPDEAR